MRENRRHINTSQIAANLEIMEGGLSSPPLALRSRSVEPASLFRATSLLNSGAGKPPLQSREIAP